MRKQGFTSKKLQLLQSITGAFIPGIPTALMGVSGAGKTILMDVLCGRKMGSNWRKHKNWGLPENQKTFSRVSGYCEQNDIHSPQITVNESVICLAWLQLPSKLDPSIKSVRYPIFLSYYLLVLLMHHKATLARAVEVKLHHKWTLPVGPVRAHIEDVFRFRSTDVVPA